MSDVRVVNSYPSKVSIIPVCACIALFAVLVSQKVGAIPAAVLMEVIFKIGNMLECSHRDDGSIPTF